MPAEPSADVRSDALRLLSNGVYVLTACPPGGDVIHAATVTWATQCSIQPPLVLVALQRNSHLAAAVRQAHRFALNILETGQEAIAEQFFRHLTTPAGVDDVGGYAFRRGAGRCPLLLDAPGWLECRLAGEVPSPGDHHLFLGELTSAGIRRKGTPMVMWNTGWSYGGIQGE